MAAGLARMSALFRELAALELLEFVRCLRIGLEACTDDDDPVLACRFTFAVLEVEATGVEGGIGESVGERSGVVLTGILILFGS